MLCKDRTYAAALSIYFVAEDAQETINKKVAITIMGLCSFQKVCSDTLMSVRLVSVQIFGTSTPFYNAFTPSLASQADRYVPEL